MLGFIRKGFNNLHIILLYAVLLNKANTEILKPNSKKSFSYFKMKRLVTLTIVIIIFLLGANSLPNCAGNVNSAQFEARHEHLQTEIDSIKSELNFIKEISRSLETNQDTLLANQDSLKEGQRVLYKQITEKSDENFLGKLYKLYKND